MCMCYFEELGPRLQISVSPLHTPLASISIGNEIKHFHRIYIYTHTHICIYVHFCIFILLGKVGPLMVTIKYQVEGQFHDSMLNAVRIRFIEENERFQNRIS